MRLDLIDGVDIGKEGGAWLREMREAAGLSQREVAERVGLTYHTFVDHVEAGSGRIAATALARWADALRIERAAFVTRLRGFDDAPRRVVAAMVEA